MALMGTAFAFDCSVNANAAEDGPPQHECDRQAAYLQDENRVAAPVPPERIDVEKAIVACEKALGQYPGSPRFQLQLARAYEEAWLFDEAVELLKKAASQGYAGAQEALGGRYWHGHGVLQSYETAVMWLRRSAVQGNGYSQALLGVAYLKGSGVVRNVEEAKNWFERSADQGNAFGLEFLALIHEGNFGFSRDLAESRRLYAHAAERNAALVDQGFTVAKDALFSIAARLFEHRYQSVDDIDIRQVRGWIERLAKDGHADAQYVLGLMYEQGYATPHYRGEPDLDSAYTWFRRAAATGSGAAHERLVGDYRRRLTFGPDYEPVIAGDVMGRPLEEAKAWLQETAEAGRMDSQLALGLAYHLGSGFERDLEAARYWYEKAAAQGSDDARRLLEQVEAEIDRRN